MIIIFIMYPVVTNISDNHTHGLECRLFFLFCVEIVHTNYTPVLVNSGLESKI